MINLCSNGKQYSKVLIPDLKTLKYTAQFKNTKYLTFYVLTKQTPFVSFNQETFCVRL